MIEPEQGRISDGKAGPRSSEKELYAVEGPPIRCKNRRGVVRRSQGMA